MASSNQPPGPGASDHPGDQALSSEGQDRDYQARALTLANIRRMRYMAWLIIVLMTVLNIILLAGKRETVPALGEPVWNLLIILRIAWIVCAVAFLVLSGHPRRPEDITRPHQVSTVVACMVALFFTALQSGLSQSSIPFITAHLLAVFTVAALIFLSSRAALLVFLPPSLLLALLLLLHQPLITLRFIHLLNLAVLTGLALIISRVNFRKEMRDIQRERLVRLQNAELERLSFVDGLTGVFNRRRLDLALNEEWRRAARQGESLALVMADIDHFKAYNDALGHQAGDQALVRVARALDEAVQRQGDIVTRYGGEEFAMLLPNTDLAGAAALAEAMRRRVAGLGINHPTAESGRLTISLGVAAGAPLEVGLPSSLVNAADQALYRAKQAGRNRVQTA